ncbi:MAG TPA: flagellar biosynthesis protein FliQ [Spirochaetales bacterium]|nr:flagellar biosynthesis protein FliQ [Spirochaetales bacterium]HOV37750.1 flagellar biosynthesis protein FliQ [Spirochaetales bacterium]
MSVGYAVYLMRSGIFQILILSAPVLLIGLIVGLIVSILQATTSIQEQTLTFVPKIAAILLALVFFGPWMFAQLSQYTVQLFQQIPQMVR